MDEWTLNDLLECSVCLERLDTSSKVLPCQHTFCKKCLEVIVNTHKELRCPECRVLVEIGIDDLPPNVLLMRILEGMRNAPRRTSSVVHTFQSETVTVADNSKPISTYSHHRVRSRSANSQVSHVPDIHQPYGIAVYDYTAKEPGDLSFKRGDMILLRRKIDKVWYQGECNGVLGVFPLPYVQVMVQLLPLQIPYPPSHIPQCKALYDFNKCSEDDGCLYFSKGDIITVIRRIDENWAEGKLDDRIGMFPITYVEMNHHAKNLMKATFNTSAMSREAPPTPTEESVPLISSDSTTLCNTTMMQSCSSEGTSSSSSTSTATTSPTSSSESTTPSTPSTSPSSSHPAQATNKRHSFTMGAQPPPYQAPPAVHRHSAEILNPEDANYDLIRQQAEQNSQKSVKLILQKTNLEFLQRKKQTELEGNSEPQSLSSPAKQLTDNVIENFQRQSSLRISKNSVSHSKPQNSPPLPAMYIAIYPYKPQKTDELELKSGSVYTVIERCQDGWFKGTSHPNQRCGVFPGNYVTPVKSLPMFHAQLKGLMHTSCSPRHDTRSTSEVRSSILQSKSNFSSISPPTAQSNGSISRLAPPELPARSISPLLLSSTSQKNASTVWHVSCSETVQEKSVSTNVSTSKSRTKTETTESSESVIVSSNSGQKSNGVKSSKSSERNKEKKEKSSVSLMRRLTSMKKSRSPPPISSYSIDNPVFEDTGSSAFVPITHVRSDSCPSQLSYNTPTHASPTNNHTNVVGGSQRVKYKQRSSLQNQFTRTFDSGSASPSNSKLTKEDKPVFSHRKSSSLDTTSYDERHKTKPSVPVPKERYRCITPYPPNSDFELELKVNDIIYVHKKREDGWYKGTLQRNGRTGMFPASFVESA